MANVLGELFGNIAAAIRSKTGDTATMKPAEFPDKIAAIEVGGGSGGGTLPAGAYWMQRATRPPRSYYNKHFVIDGVLYLLSRTSSGSGSSVQIYKYADGAYTSLATSDVFYLSLTSATPTKFGNTIYFVGQSELYILSWDGASTVKLLNNLPAVSRSNLFVYNDEMYIALQRAFYKYDATTDSWTEVCSVPSTYTTYYCFVKDGIAYALRSGNANIYQLSLEDGNHSIVKTLSDNVSVSGTFYYDESTNINYVASGSTGAQVLLKHDLTNDIRTEVGTIPHIDSNYTFYFYENRLCASGGTTVTRNDLMLYVVEAE